MASIGPWLGGGRRGGGSGEMDPWFGFSTPFSSDVWDPFSYGWGSSRSGGGNTSSSAHANVDWRETDKAHIFRADLPGVRKEEVKVQVEEGNILQISGERIKEQEDESGKWHHLERLHGCFVRRFRLPENAKMDEVQCMLQNGVLTVEVPKKETENSSKNVRYIDVA